MTGALCLFRQLLYLTAVRAKTVQSDTEIIKIKNDDQGVTNLTYISTDVTIVFFII